MFGLLQLEKAKWLLLVSLGDMKYSLAVGEREC